MLLRGLDATDDERLLITNILSGAPTMAPNVVSLLDALGGIEAIDRGRELETVVWRYEIGTKDADDCCVEIRRTRIGPHGLRLATFGPGEFGRADFPLVELPNLDMRVGARRLEGASFVPIPTSLHVVELEPARGGYRVVVQFGGLTSGPADIEWLASYRWPGLWRSLRANGTAVGRLRFGGSSPKVTVATVELAVPLGFVDDLELKPLRRIGQVRRETDAEKVIVRWTVESPPQELRFDVVSAHRRRR